MDRRHRGRVLVGEWVIAGVEWSGRVRGNVVGSEAGDRDYRYTGLVMMRLREGRIAEHIIHGDAPTLLAQLAGTGSQENQDLGPVHAAPSRA